MYENEKEIIKQKLRKCGYDISNISKIRLKEDQGIKFFKVEFKGGYDDIEVAIIENEADIVPIA